MRHCSACESRPPDVAPWLTLLLHWWCCCGAGVLRQALQDELPPSTLRGMFEQLARSYAEVLAAQLAGGAEWPCGVDQVGVGVEVVT
jgi:hypothetical protein